MNIDLVGSHGGWLQVLGQTLIHSLWQGLLVAAGYAVARRLLKSNSVRARYAAGCAALGLLAVLPVVTLVFLEGSATSRTQLPPTRGLAAGTFDESVQRSGQAGTTRSGIAPDRIRRWNVPSACAVIWLAGVGLFAVRLGAGAWGLRKLRLASSRAVGEEWQAAFRQMCQRMGVRRVVELMQCDRIEVPSVMGWLRPVILVPSATLCGLSAQQFEAILAHELAHILRHDYLANWLQRVLEVAWFHHPAARWIGNCVREDRELCCDEWAVRVCGDRVGYARALVTLESTRGGGLMLALGAADGTLRDRVMWVLGKGKPGERGAWRSLGLLMGAAAFMVVAVAASGGWSGRMYEATSRVRIQARETLGLGMAGKEAGYDPYQIQTEMQAMVGSAVLGGVVDSLNLTEVFSGRAGLGIQPNRDAVIGFLLKRVRVSQYRNTEIVQVSARSEIAEEAARLANEVVSTYQKVRATRQEVAARESELELEKSYEVSRETVAKLEDTLRQKMGRLGLFRRDLNETNGVDLEALRSYQREEAALDLRIQQSESQLKELGEMPMSQRTRAISASSMPDVLLTKLLQDLHSAEQSQASLRTDFGDRVATVQANERLVRKIDEQITDRVKAWMEARRAEVRRDRNHRDALKERVDRLVAERRAEMELVEDRRELNQARERRDQLRARIEERREQSKGQGLLIEVIDVASPPPKPSTWF